MAQRTWSIEARMDFADMDKNAEIDELVRRLAVQLSANLSLLADGGQKPHVIAHSDDFFGDTKHISLWGEAHPEIVGTAENTDEVSEEMLEAMREMQK